MPYDFAYRNRHAEIPGEVAGYELAPFPIKGCGLSFPLPAPLRTSIPWACKCWPTPGPGCRRLRISLPRLVSWAARTCNAQLTRPRPIVLSCIAQGLTFAQVQRIKNLIIAQVAPYNSLQTSKALNFTYQLVNYCGEAIGTALEVAVTYAGDLTGSTTNLYQDRFDLQFVEFAPPGIKELTTIQPSLAYLVTQSATQGIRYKSATTGEWKFISLTGPKVVAYDQTGNLWYGSSTTVTNRSGSTSQAVNGAVRAIVSDQNNNIFVGGSFTTPQADIMVYNGSSWGAIFLLSGLPINGAVRAMAFDNAGALYIGGDFTNPQTGIIKYVYSTYGSSGGWVSIGALASVRAIVCGQDGNMYFGKAGGVFRWDGTSLTQIGTTNGGSLVETLALLPDGRILAGGLFTTMTGVTGSAVTAVGVAVYNYTGWQQLGNGLGQVGTAEVTGLAVNKTTGDVYATGFFSMSGTLPLTFGFARFNGSNWIFGDATNTYTSQGQGSIA
jgi:hypothetical protein